jgi:glycosyltransferase involved in cell wall biosynthesis
VLILQPTRIVRRKAIQRAVRLIELLGDKRYKLVITGSSGDEGYTYEGELRSRINEAGIEALFIRDLLSETRSIVNGQKRYALWDAYAHANFVTYPSEYEGFGNALIETMYFRKPLLVNRYSIYVADIAPTGVDAIEINGRVTQDTADAVRDVLNDPGRVRQMVDHNYEVGRKHFSYEMLQAKLEQLLADF